MHHLWFKSVENASFMRKMPHLWSKPVENASFMVQISAKCLIYDPDQCSIPDIAHYGSTAKTGRKSVGATMLKDTIEAQ